MVEISDKEWKQHLADRKKRGLPDIKPAFAKPVRGLCVRCRKEKVRIIAKGTNMEHFGSVCATCNGKDKADGVFVFEKVRSRC